MITLTKEKAHTLSPITLAFLGDGVYETYVREKLVLKGNMKSAILHKEAVKLVRASFQSHAVDIILPLLSEDELYIYKRGRNSNNNTVPQSSNPRDYRRATGLEALFGYLHIIGDEMRGRELFEVIYCEREKCGN